MKVVKFHACLDDRIVIMAIMHLHRDPDYWKER